MTREIENGRDFCQKTLEDLPADDSWDQLRHDLLETSKQTPDTQSKVVVLGASGVGKSSVLNALLGEANILPSSAVGDACTAVPIEIHYNDDPQCIDVKAEIQYVTEAVWRKVIQEAKIEADVDEDDYSDRGQGALKRMNLVYSLQDYEILTKSVDDIIAMNNSNQLLDKCVTLQADNRIDFNRDFKQQIGSIKKPGSATWPMIDHVRLYVRHPLLQNGLVLVDIPGMFETNQARVENADNYLQKCSAVMIMTPAARSNSDAAQDSLASRALRKVQFDQRLDSVLYVCTKSDALDLEDALDELDVPEAIPLQSQLKAAQQDRQRTSDQGNALILELEEQKKIAKDTGNDILRWNKAAKAAEYAKDWGSFRPPRPRLSNGKFLKVEASDEVWDKDSVTAKVNGFKRENTTASKRSKELRKIIAVNERRLEDLEANIEKVGLDLKRAVFTARNELVKEQQAKRYLSAVEKYERESSKAVKQIVGLAGDETTQSVTFDNVKEKVFCVSAQAYSRIAKLKRYAIKEGAEEVRDHGSNATFLTNVQDTEIPALARRLKFVALTERHSRLQKIQLKLQIACASLRSRFLPSLQRTEINEEAAAEATQDVVGAISRFATAFGDLVITTAAVKRNYKKQFTEVLSQAETFVLPRAMKRLKSRDQHPGNGGSNLALFPIELKASAAPSRNGFYIGRRKLSDGESLRVNINDDMADLIKRFAHKMIKNVLSPDRGSVQLILIERRQELEKIMDELHEEFRLKATTAGVDLRRINLADEKHQMRMRELQDLFSATVHDISQSHVSAGKRIERDIQDALKPAYARAYSRSGTGARTAMVDELCQATTKDDVVRGTLSLLDNRIGLKHDKILLKLENGLTAMASSIAADYRGIMEHRDRVIETLGNPALDRIRGRMIARGYEDLEASVPGVKEEVLAKLGSGAVDHEKVMAEIIREAGDADDAEVKHEDSDEEVTDEESSDMTDEEV